MSKKTKKRNKKYTGQDSKQSRPTIYRYTAVERTKVGEWWQDNKKAIKPIAIVVGIVVLIIWLALEFIRVIS